MCILNIQQRESFITQNASAGTISAFISKLVEQWHCIVPHMFYYSIRSFIEYTMLRMDKQ